MKEDNSASIPDTGATADADKSDANEELSIAHHIVAQSFQGPLPPPTVLAQYDEVVPSLAKKIADNMFQQSDHRMANEKRIILSVTRNLAVSQWMTFFITLVSLAGGIYLIATGIEPYGFAIVLFGVASLAGSFINKMWKRSSQIEELDETIPFEYDPPQDTSQSKN